MVIKKVRASFRRLLKGQMTLLEMFRKYSVCVDSKRFGFLMSRKNVQGFWEWLQLVTCEMLDRAFRYQKIMQLCITPPPSPIRIVPHTVL